MECGALYTHRDRERGEEKRDMAHLKTIFDRCQFNVMLSPPQNSKVKKLKCLKVA